MRYLKNFKIFESGPTLTEEQIKFLDQNCDGIWTLNSETGLIDVEGDFYLDGDISKTFIKNPKFLPVEFGKVSGTFRIIETKLISLKGSPIRVGGDFDCSGNKLASLEGSPMEVGGEFECSSNGLTSLRYATREVGGNFICINNKLRSLEGAPIKVGKNLDCRMNPIISLEGAPLEIGGEFLCLEDIRIDWNLDGWLWGMTEYPNLFKPIVDDEERTWDTTEITPGVINRVRREYPEIFDILSKRLGDGTTTAADLGELGF